MPAPPPTPAGLLASLPAHLGRPVRAGEVIGLGWHDDAPDAVVVATHPLDPSNDPIDEAEVIRQLVIDGAQTAAVIVTAGPWAATQYPTPDLVGRYLGAVAGRYGLELLDVLTVVGDRWRSLACVDPTCCPPEGKPMPHLTAREDTPTP